VAALPRPHPARDPCQPGLGDLGERVAPGDGVEVRLPGDDGSLFTTSTGHVYGREYYGALFTAAAKRAGLPEGTTSHDLRHHYASVLLAAGESVVAVAERLGHENATLVLKTYGHLMPDSEDRTRLAVDEAWCAITVPSARLATN
jgi:integrase